MWPTVLRPSMFVDVPDDRSSSETLSILLDAAPDDADRVARLLPLVYDQLRAVAERALATERPDHTLQATALVHEAYLRLVGEREVPWSSKAHFYVAAAEAPRIKRIAFIGSPQTGRAIQRAAAEVTVKHISLELGGKNPMIVFPDCDPEKVAAAAVMGMNFSWQGQSCLPSRLRHWRRP